MSSSGSPMKALWEALNDTAIGTDTIMAMILDPKCGIERRSAVGDGKMLDTTGNDTNQNGGCTPLIMAAIANRDDVLEALLAAGADATSADSRSGRMSLHQAVVNDNAHALQLLLEHFCKSGIRWCRRDAVPAANTYYHYVNAADTYGWTPLLLAAAYCFSNCVELLLQYGADPGERLSASKQRTSSHVSASGCDTASLDLLLAAGADVYAQDDNSHTPLHLASVSGSRGCIGLLMEEGSFVDPIDCEGRTPLHYAVEGLTLCSALLLSYGATINAVTNDGSTPLRLSASSGDANCVLLLCSEGADVNAVDVEGFTAIQGAVSSEAPGGIEILLDNGADMSAMDKAFITRATSCAECIDVLQSEGFNGDNW